MPLAARLLALFGVGVISIPLLGLAPRLVRQMRERDRRGVAISLFLLMALVVALYGLATNSDFPDVECTVLFAAGAVVTFGLRWNGTVLRRVFIAIVCASVAGDLYYGARRVRVYGIGPGRFFAWHDNRHRIDSGYLKNMRVSSTMVEVEREVELAHESNAGPYFFGPRLEFNYAVLRLMSPEHSPVLWDPGAALAELDQARLVGVWQEHRFGTLIFLKAGNPYGIDHIYYPQELLDAIRRGYVEDGSYSWITVYHRRANGPGEP
jgi:MFS family permease